MIDFTHASKVWEKRPGSKLPLMPNEALADLLDPGAGKTKTAYIWAYAPTSFHDNPGVIYDFCVGRGGKYPAAFLKGWSSTLVCDDYKGYDSVLKLERRVEAGCMAHARRKFDELIKINQSPTALQAVQRIAWLYRIEQEVKGLYANDRLAVRQTKVRPLC